MYVHVCVYVCVCVVFMSSLCVWLVIGGASLCSRLVCCTRVAMMDYMKDPLGGLGGPRTRMVRCTHAKVFERLYCHGSPVIYFDTYVYAHVKRYVVVLTVRVCVCVRMRITLHLVVVVGTQMSAFPFMPDTIMYMSRQSQSWFFNNMANGSSPYANGAQGWAPGTSQSVRERSIKPSNLC